jgi:hypothetical protein
MPLVALPFTVTDVNTISTHKQELMVQYRHVACNWEMRNANKILIRKCQEKILIENLWSKWEDNKKCILEQHK